MEKGVPMRLLLLLLEFSALGCRGSGGGSSSVVVPNSQTVAKVYEKTIASLRAGTPDTHGDGIPDNIKRDLLHTDPSKVDTDGDGTRTIYRALSEPVEFFSSPMAHTTRLRLIFFWRNR